MFNSLKNCKDLPALKRERKRLMADCDSSELEQLNTVFAECRDNLMRPQDTPFKPLKVYTQYMSTNPAITGYNAISKENDDSSYTVTIVDPQPIPRDTPSDRHVVSIHVGDRSVSLGVNL